MRRILIAVVGVVVLALVVAAVVVTVRPAGYELKVAMPNAIGVVEGTPVRSNGSDVGRVSAVEAVKDHAVVTVAFDAASERMRAGTEATVEFRSLLGERTVNLSPGAPANPELPTGTMISAGAPQVLVEDVLEALDPPTRAHLSGLINRLGATLSPSTSRDLNRTLETAGPAVEALGGLLRAVGQDGPAIRTLVSNLAQVTDVLAQRKDSLSGTVQGLGEVTAAAAAQQKALSTSLEKAPSTLDAFNALLERFPNTTDELLPLLRDLKPAAARLPGVAAQLEPLVNDLRPVVRDLRPTLEGANRLLGSAPPFLDSSSAVAPELQRSVQELSPAVAFLRPYTPEVVGFAANWGNLFSTYDSMGHFAHPLVVTGKTALDNNPPVLIPGEKVNDKPRPGTYVGQPFTDASGGEVR